jgi:hypothetical protein
MRRFKYRPGGVGPEAGALPPRGSTRARAIDRDDGYLEAGNLMPLADKVKDYAGFDQ